MLNGRFEEARHNLDEAYKILDRLREDDPANAEVILLAARLATNRGDLASFENERKKELPFFEEASRLFYDYARLKPSSDALFRAYRSTTLLTSALADNQRYSEVLAVLHERESTIQYLLSLEPQNPNYLRQWLAAANYEGEIYDNESGRCLNQPAQAITALRRYVEIASRLASADPSNASARLSLAIAYFSLSWPAGKLNPAEGLSLANTSVKIFDEELARHPGDRLLISRRTRALRHVAHAQRRLGHMAEARATLREAIAIQEKLVHDTPGDKNEREELGKSGDLLKSFGHLMK